MSCLNKVPSVQKIPLKIVIDTSHAIPLQRLAYRRWSLCTTCVYAIPNAVFKRMPLLGRSRSPRTQRIHTMWYFILERTPSTALPWMRNAQTECTSNGEMPDICMQMSSNGIMHYVPLLFMNGLREYRSQCTGHAVRDRLPTCKYQEGDCIT